MVAVEARIEGSALAASATRQRAPTIHFMSVVIISGVSMG